MATKYMHAFPPVAYYPYCRPLVQPFSMSAHQRPQHRHLPCPQYPRNNPFPRQTFHTTVTNFGGIRAAWPRKDPHERGQQRRFERQKANNMMSGMPSTMVEAQEQLRSGVVPDDIGLLPGTLIWPTGPEGLLADYPWVGRKFWTRTRLEAKRRWKKVKEFGTLFASERQKGKWLPRLKLRRTKMVAKSLHRAMYTAFARAAEKDFQKIHDITCSTLRQQLEYRMRSRSRNISYEWIVHEYIKVEVASDRSSIMPVEVGENSTDTSVRQAVVRIRSRQSLIRHIAEDAEVQAVGVQSQAQGSPEEQVRDVIRDEYLVIQKQKIQGVEKGWRDWGTTEETEDIEEAFDADDTVHQAGST